MGKTVSLNPENFIEGGGLIDDVDVIIKEARFEMFDYQGTAPAVPSLRITMEVNDEEMSQNYSMGNANDWVPSDDGSQLIAVGNATAIRLTSNGGIFLKSLIDAGFPPEKLGDDITILDGLDCHVMRVPAPERKGVTKSPKQKEREEKFGPPTLLVVSDINTLPWEKKDTKKKASGKPSGTAGKKKATKKADKDEADAGDVEAKATEVILGLIEEYGTLKKKDLPTKIFQAMKNDPARNAVVKIVFDDEFLGNGPWEYEDGAISE